MTQNSVPPDSNHSSEHSASRSSSISGIFACTLSKRKERANAQTLHSFGQLEELVIIHSKLLTLI